MVASFPTCALKKASTEGYCADAANLKNNMNKNITLNWHLALMLVSMVIFNWVALVPWTVWCGLQTASSSSQEPRWLPLSPWPLKIGDFQRPLRFVSVSWLTAMTTAQTQQILHSQSDEPMIIETHKTLNANVCVPAMWSRTSQGVAQ